MRRLTARLALFTVALAALAGSGLGAGCSRDARPASEPARPDEPPPLPPASGTPIGYLLDDAALSLSQDQRTRLQAIDDDLAVKLSYLDTVARNTGSGNAPPAEPGRGGATFGAASQRDGHDTGHITGREGTGNAVVATDIPPDTASDNAAIHQRVPEVRAHDVRAAIAHALEVLDPEQRKIARKILVDRGVDPDTGRFQAQGDPGSAGREGSGSRDSAK